ncbi:MAG: DUF1861 family protein [Calditrichia bacterium]
MNENPSILKFGGKEAENKDVYNPTAPFLDRGIKFLAARVESRASEMDTQTLFFREENGVWQHDSGTPGFPLQDPFICRIGQEIVFGGVRFPVENNSWRTEFYKGADLLHLKKFAEGPLGMKDIRLVELHDHRVGLFTRPQGEIGGRGKIGFTVIDSLEKLNETKWLGAELIPRQFGEEEWGGANEVHLLREGLVGVLGHKASFSYDKEGRLLKHYYSAVFSFEYILMKASPLKIVARRSDFPKGEAKRSPELDDVLYSGGLRALDDHWSELYAGLSDVQCGRIVIKNPFREYLGG